MAKKPNFGGLQGSNWKHSGMTPKRYDALAKAHAAAAALRKGSGKGKSNLTPKVAANLASVRKTGKALSTVKAKAPYDPLKGLKSSKIDMTSWLSSNPKAAKAIFRSGAVTIGGKKSKKY